MSQHDAKLASVSAVGWMLRQWRTARGWSQQALADEAAVSTRHLSFVETGRAEPSRELLLRLSAAMGMPPRDRNALLSSAGYQPIYRELPLHAPQMSELRQALLLILRQQDPFASVALDRDFDIVMCNKGFSAFMHTIGGHAPSPFKVLDAPRLNLLDLTFDPAIGVRPLVKNWEQVSRAILWRARAEIAATRDRHGHEILERVRRHPGVAELLDKPEDSGGDFVIPLRMQLGDMALNMFTTITTLGTPQDLTACELRIETYHPADEASEQLIRTVVAAYEGA